MEDASPLISSSSPSDALSSSTSSTHSSTTTTTVTPAGSVGTSSTYLPLRCGLPHSDSPTNSAIFSRPHRVRSTGLTSSLTNTNPVTTTSRIHVLGSKDVSCSTTTNNSSTSNHAVSIITPAPSSTESTSINSSGSHRNTLESPLSQEEDDFFVPVILRR